MFSQGFSVEIKDNPQINIEQLNNIVKDTKYNEPVITKPTEKTEDRKIEISVNAGDSITPDKRINQLEEKLELMKKQNELVTDTLLEIKNSVVKKHIEFENGVFKETEKKIFHLKKMKILYQEKMKSKAPLLKKKLIKHKHH